MSWQYLKKILVHVTAWLMLLGIIAYGFTINLNAVITTQGRTSQVGFTLLPIRLELYGLIFKIGFFYFEVFYIFSKFFKKKPRLLFFLLFLSCAIVFYFLEIYLLKEFVIGDMFSENEFSAKSYSYYLYRVNPLMYFIISIFSFIYFFIAERIQNEKIKNLVKQEQLKTELSLLKYQINPHFLFNTLNNFYSIAQEYNVQPLELGIMKLSKMMRYNLYESDHELVPLSKELEYIDNYISIYQFKFDKKDKFEFKLTINGSPENKYIVPFLFLPLVENALKHGFRYNKTCFAHIQIDIMKDYLELNVINSLHKDNNVLKDNYGIGLSNIQKRLALIYPGKYLYKIQESGNTFSTYLKVPTHEQH